MNLRKSYGTRCKLLLSQRFHRTVSCDSCGYQDAGPSSSPSMEQLTDSLGTGFRLFHADSRASFADAATCWRITKASPILARLQLHGAQKLGKPEKPPRNECSSTRIRYKTRCCFGQKIMAHVEDHLIKTCQDWQNCSWGS